MMMEDIRTSSGRSASLSAVRTLEVKRKKRSRKGRGQKVSESESFSVFVPSLDGPEGSLGLRGA